MTPTQSLSERLRMEGRGTDWSDIAREAADALDAKDKEIVRLRETILDALDDEVAQRMMSKWCADATAVIGEVKP